MPEETLREELETAIERDESFGPAYEGVPLREVPAETLRKVILASSGDDDGVKRRLQLRRVQVVGTLNLEAQRIGLRLQLNDCELTGDLNLYQGRAVDIALISCVLKGGLYGSQLELCWNLRLDDSKVRDGVWLLGAKIGGQLSLKNAKLRGVAGVDGKQEAALTADGAEVNGDMFCEDLASRGTVRLLGTKIGGQLSLKNAKLRGVAEIDEKQEVALEASRLEVSEDMFSEGLTSKGTVRLLGAKIGGELSLKNAKLKGAAGVDGKREAALDASRIEVRGELLCEGLRSEGTVWLIGAKVRGQLDWTEASLVSKDPDRDCLLLVSAEIDELILGFEETTGAVNLTDAKVRSLWDAKRGKFLGKLPKTLRLQGLHFESLRVPLGAAKRLDWIERSQQDQHYPGVYAEVAEAYRRIGLRPDAREIGIANEKRAREDGALVKKLWSYLLWKSVRYGYENWRAAAWLLAVITIGSILFCIGDDHFVATVKDPPDRYPFIYATDAAIPVLSLGQTSTWTTDGWLEWVELGLAISGYALVAAVIAGLAGIFNRDQV